MHDTRPRPVTGATERLGQLPIRLLAERHRTAIIWLLGVLLFIRLIAALPDEPPRAAPPPASEIHVGSDWCVGWCPK